MPETPPQTPPSPPGPKPAHDFSTLYRATVTPLRRYLARLLGNTSEAQDIAHDAYLRLYPKLKSQSAEQPEALL
jgi:RNA polymerase sigma-70 factor (ECF subfamily)